MSNSNFDGRNSDRSVPMPLFSAEKRFRRAIPEDPAPTPDPDGPPANAFVNGAGAVTVTDPLEAGRLYAMGNYGTFVGQRMNFANWHCFRPPSSVDEDSVKKEEIQDRTDSEDKKPELEPDRGQQMAKEAASEWTKQTVGGGGQLHLSAEEALYLVHGWGDSNPRCATYQIGHTFISQSHDLGVLTLRNGPDTVLDPSEWFGTLQKQNSTRDGDHIVHRYLVYSFFRRLGWVVRDGISFGVDFLLYKHSVDAYHSSAGVLIWPHADAARALTSPHVGALQRELANCKKRLLVARVCDEMGDDLQGVLQHAKIQVLSVSGWSANRSRITDLDQK